MADLSPRAKRNLDKTFQMIEGQGAVRAIAEIWRTLGPLTGGGGTTITPTAIPAGVGDWIGQVTANVVAAIRGTPVSPVPPVEGQVLVYDGAAWVPGAPGDSSGTVIDYSSLVNEATTPQGAVFSASSTSGDASHTAAFAADNDDATYWLSAQSVAPADPADAAWWKADLGSAKEITYYRVVQPSQTQYRATSSKLQSSTDNAAWTDQVSFGVFGDSGLTELPAPVTARYWRLLGVEMDPLLFAANYWGLATVALYSGAPTIATTGHTIADEGTPLTQRATLDFVGAGVTVTDDAGDGKTVVTITAGASSTRWELLVDGDNEALIWADGDLIYVEIPLP